MRLTGLEYSNSQTCASNTHARHGVLLTGNMSETRRFVKRHVSQLPKETHDGGSEPSHQGRLSSELQYSRVRYSNQPGEQYLPGYLLGSNTCSDEHCLPG